MKSRISYIFITLFCILGYIPIKAQPVQLSDSAQVSLLTNTPWNGAVYALFGHTAIRINDPVKHIDEVFNYGLFDFNSPNFEYRFARGETDYSVGSVPFNRYLSEYQSKGIGITEQILNLSRNEKQNLLNALVTNCLAQNRVYRYNYFYDNCTTRARDIIEKNTNGTVIYLSDGNLYSYRDLVHQCVDSEPWVRFGIDLVIGADADKPIDERQEHFLPAYLMNAFSKANIQNNDGSSRKLILFEKEILKPTDRFNARKPLDAPLIIGFIILIISIIISYLSYGKKKRTAGKIYDFLLFLLAGIAGSIIFFLMVFSVHPCTNPNWNLVWLNPVQLIFAFLFLIKFFSKGVYYYHFINFALLIVFLLAWFLIPQYLELAFLPYILSLIVRSGTNVFEYKRNIR